MFLFCFLRKELILYSQEYVHQDVFMVSPEDSVNLKTLYNLIIPKGGSLYRTWEGDPSCFLVLIFYCAQVSPGELS